MTAQQRPRLVLGPPRGARTTAETPAEIIAWTECSGIERERRSLMAAMVRVTATMFNALATTTEARASARRPLVGSRRSTPKRHTRPTDPATSARTLSPKPRTPRLPASSPAVTAHAPATSPHATEKYESAKALASSGRRIGSTSSSRSVIEGQSCWRLPEKLTQ